MKEIPSYYSFLPAHVRYDKELKPMTKIMYSEIVALTQKLGYCWSKNEYFATLYEVSKETVSRWISQLNEKGYIEIKLIYHPGTKQIKERHIIPNTTPIYKPIDNLEGTDKKIKGVDDKKINTPIDKKIKDNTTSNTNTTSSFNKSKEIKETNKGELLYFETIFKEKFNSDVSYTGQFNRNFNLESINRLLEIKKTGLREFFAGCLETTDTLLKKQLTPAEILFNLNKFNVEVATAKPILKNPGFKEYTRAQITAIANNKKGYLYDYEAATYQGRYFFAKKTDIIKFELATVDQNLVIK